MTVQDRERVEKELRENIAKLSIGSSISQSNNEEVSLGCTLEVRRPVSRRTRENVIAEQ